MRTLAIGDIHGCLRALDSVLALARPHPHDRIVTVGDYVDRGPDSPGVIDRLLELQARHKLICLRGNHDIMMMDARFDPLALAQWLPCGGRQTLDAYGMLGAVPDRHWAFLEATRPYFETAKHFFVHANVHADVPLHEQADSMLYWDKLADEYSTAHRSGKIMICGHTSQRSGVPLDLGHAVCIDTFVYGTGWLTCLDVDSGRYWQARQSGETRTGWLGEPLTELE